MSLYPEAKEMKKTLGCTSYELGMALARAAIESGIYKGHVITIPRALAWARNNIESVRHELEKLRAEAP